MRPSDVNVHQGLVDFSLARNHTTSNEGLPQEVTIAISAQAQRLDSGRTCLHALCSLGQLWIVFVCDQCLTLLSVREHVNQGC